MQLTVFGGTGRTGRKVIEQALTRGYRVRILCRTAGALAVPHPDLEVLAGSLTDPKAVERSLTGSRAVVIVFGPRPPYQEIFCADATATILNAMRQCGVRRVVCVTGAMIGEGVRRSWAFERLARYFRRRAPALAADRAEQERLVKTSGLDWTLVKPPRLAASAGTGRYSAGAQVRVGLLSRISREDLARFILDELNSTENLGRAVVIRH